MSVSLISDYYECLVCGKNRNLHKHHIYEGIGRRDQSEKYGCWCYLCARHHNMSDVGVHYNKAFDLKLKRKCQKILEEQKGWSREQFTNVFGMNYLDDKEGDHD